MYRKNLAYSLAFILIIGFILFALPEKGFSGVPLPPLVCCQGEGSCTDNTDGISICSVDNTVVNAFCDQDTGLCTRIGEATNIPTLSEWGLTAMAGILAIAGLIVMRRKKASA